MEILDFCVRENGKHCLVKKSGIWIGSFNCVQSESGQILLWSSRAWRKFICKLHPIFGEIAPFSNSSPDAELTQNSLFHKHSFTWVYFSINIFVSAFYCHKIVTAFRNVAGWVLIWLALYLMFEIGLYVAWTCLFDYFKKRPGNM